MEAERGRIGRGLGVAGTITALAMLALALRAQVASGAPLSMTFTEARANVGVQLSDASLFEAPETASLEAEIGPAGESITAGDLQVPQFSTHITEPLEADVDVDFEIGTITGSFIEASGALTLQGDASATLTSEGKECSVSTTPSPLILSTAGNSGGTSPRAGVPFSHGLSGAGAIAGQWTDMRAEPKVPGVGIAVCETVDERIEGAGGIWLVQEGDVTPPSAPQLSGTDPTSPGASGTPRILGAAEAGATVSVYAGPDCVGAPVATGSAAELGSPGILVNVAEGSTTAFSAIATDVADNASVCSAPISYTHLKAIGPLPPSRACIVPKLIGKKLKVAKRKLKRAGCRVGRVRGPRKGKKRRALIVRSSRPRAGTVLELGSRVSLRLGPRRRSSHHHRR